MTMQPVPQKKFELANGQMGTEYEHILESIKWWEKRRQGIDDVIEDLRRRLDLAEGHP